MLEKFSFDRIQNEVTNIVNGLISYWPFDQKFINLRLESVRFHKILENVRGIIDIFEDGKEKLEEDYIFDRHYVYTLVDQAILFAEQMVFSACVLAPSQGEKLFQLLDEHVRILRKKFPRNAEQKNIDSETDIEQQLLSQVLACLMESEAHDTPVLMDLIKDIFDIVILGIEVSQENPIGTHRMNLNTNGINNTFELINFGDAISAKKGDITIREVNSQPLGMMFVGATEEKLNGIKPVSKIMEDQSPIRNWLAFISKEYIRLQKISSNSRALLVGSLSGYVGSDFIFVYTQDPIDIRQLLPIGFRVEKTKQGSFAWCYNLPRNEMENRFSKLGRNFFSLRSV